MNARTLTQLGLVVVALVSAATVSGNGTTVDIPLPGTKIRLNDTSGRVGRRNYVALRDGAQSVPLPDPRVTGATASIGRVGAGDVTVLDLPASGWSGSTSTGDYKFKSRSGAVISARLNAGRSIRFSARGDGAYPLAGIPQGGVGIIIDVAGVRFCGFFGGTILRDDGKRFRAKLAPAPASCPVLGTTTSTTRTSTSSSSTSTSTTSTTTSTTTTTLGTADLSLTKVAAPTFISGGIREVTFTVTLHNAGPDEATGVEVTDKLTDAFAFQLATSSQGSYSSGTGVWTVGTLAKDADAALAIMTLADACGPFRFTTQTNTAEVTEADQTDPDSTDDQAVASVVFGCN